MNNKAQHGININERVNEICKLFIFPFAASIDTDRMFYVREGVSLLSIKAIKGTRGWFA